jgi:hypothetical protein
MQAQNQSKSILIQDSQVVTINNWSIIMMYIMSTRMKRPQQLRM